MRIRLLLPLVCWFLLLSSACTSAATLIPAPIHVKVVISPFLSYSPFFLAQENGYFQEQGLDVAFVKFSSDAEAVPSLLSGELDVSAGIMAANQFNAIAKGNALKYVADKGYYDPASCPANAILIQKSLLDNHVLDTPDKLKGLRVNYRKGSYPGYVMDTFLSSKGVTLQDMQVQNLSEPANTQALTNGAIDLAFSSEPNMSLALNSDKVAVAERVEDITGDKQLAVVLYGPNLLTKNPDTGRRFIKAYLKGVAEFNKGKTDANLNTIAKYTALDRKLLEQACWQPIRADGTIDTGTVMNFQKWALDHKLIDQIITPDKFWDPQFINSAKSTQ